MPQGFGSPAVKEVGYQQLENLDLITSQNLDHPPTLLSLIREYHFSLLLSTSEIPELPCASFCLYTKLVTTVSSVMLLTLESEPGPGPGPQGP